VNKSSAETNLDSIFGRLVVERNLCTADELQKCLEGLRQAPQEPGANRPMALADVLVEKGYVTRSQIDRVRKSAEEYRPAAHQIPGFQIQKKLGAGAMAVVYKAKQISLDRTVAVKILPKRLSENPEYVERFYKEGRAAAKLNHNNIVQAIDVGDATGVHYFVMEYVEGKTVYDDISKGKAYSETEALDIIIQIADALQHAHERGLIHRDVKPKNIMITKDGVAKLADMGLAREVSDQVAAEMEQGRAYGTPYYIAPEQIRGELDIDQRADIYSLGATFYHMITGRVPFDGPTPSAVMHKHLKDPLIPPDHLNPALSVGVAEVIEVMMAKKRTDRYDSAKLLLEDLRAVRNGEPPMLAHQKFDSSVLADLEKGKVSAYDENEIEQALRQSAGQVGMKIAVIILSGLLMISLLAIIILLMHKS
jgi:eukaryotic-like serine/threonine-protein kinase